MADVRNSGGFGDREREVSIQFSPPTGFTCAHRLGAEYKAAPPPCNPKFFFNSSEKSLLTTLQ
jgi:hypothetical protein